MKKKTNKKSSKKSSKAKTQTEVYELDKTALKSLSKEVVKGIKPVVTSKVKELMDDYIEDHEKTIDKATGLSPVEAGKNYYVGDLSNIKKIPRHERAIDLGKAVQAFLNEDKNAVVEYNEKIAERKEKAGYANTLTDSEGKYIELDPEFEAEIESLSEDYGISLKDADTRQIRSAQIKTNKRGSNVTMYEVGQGASIKGTKLTIEQVTATLRKFAGIAVTTNELTEDQAIDFASDLVQGFAEERARVADELIFTDTNETYPGILHTDGINVETVGAAITDITWDDLLNAEAKIPTKARANMKHYMHRTIWNLILQNKDDEGRYQALPYGTLTTPWGTPIVLTDSLPDSSVVGDSNEGYVVTGDLKRARLYMKKGLRFDESGDATVTDADDVTVNLFEQDMSALRAIMRMMALIKFPEAFCVIGTGTVS